MIEGIRKVGGNERENRRWKREKERDQRLEIRDQR